MDAYQIKKDSAVVVDFSVIIQRYAGVLEGKSATFLKLYEMIENHVRSLFRVYKFIRVDLVMDFYHSLSLKSSTRENRGLGKVANFVISDLLPANLQKDFLRNDNNKKQLNKMFKHRLLESDIPEGSILVVSDEQERYLSNSNDILGLDDIGMTRIEEADSRIILHIISCLNSGYKSVLIETYDTDVIFIAMSYFSLMTDEFN